MTRLALGLAFLAATVCVAPEASAADLSYKRARYAERVYQRPIPRVYYQSARPTMVCRVGFLDHDRGWPKEQRGVARCTRLD